MVSLFVKCVAEVSKVLLFVRRVAGGRHGHTLCKTCGWGKQGFSQNNPLSWQSYFEGAAAWLR